MRHHCEPVVALMGLAFKPNINDLCESSAKYIASKIVQSHNNADFLIVELNITEHKVFKLTNYKDAYEKADIVVFLFAHDEFKHLSYSQDIIILDFSSVFKK